MDFFVVTAPGLEPLAAHELGALGLAPGGEPEQGGVGFTGTLESAARANLWLRTASRVLARLGDFHARALGELERRARSIPFERVVAPGAVVRLRVTARRSRLYHTGAIAERISSAIAARVPGVSVLGDARDGDADEARSRDDADEARDGDDARSSDGAQPADDARSAGGAHAAGNAHSAVDARSGGDAQLIVVRLLRDRCEVSADSSGELLHRRGYRLATGKAPVRETLAAAALLAGGWNGATPLLDPLCGAGTIPIEGALMARGIAPGLGRRFAFMRWPEFGTEWWSEMVSAARSNARSGATVPILGSDRDSGAVAAAVANAERAGVAGDIEFSERALSAIEPPAGPGWLITNPPYGVRVGERDRLRNLYARLGHVARERCPGWELVMISADAALERQLGIPLEEVLRTRNGGIPVRVVRGRI